MIFSSVRSQVRTALTLLVSACPAWASTTWFVDASAPGPGTGTLGDPYRSIQFAIDAAETLPGDTLEIAEGTYLETINLRGKDLILDGSQAATLPVIDAQGTGAVVTVAGGQSLDCRLQSLVITGGTGRPIGSTLSRGGGVFVESSGVTFASVSFLGNGATLGGGVYVFAGLTHYEDCTFQGNRAETGGGVYCRTGDAIFTGGSFLDNEAEGLTGPGFGGAVQVENLSVAEFTGVTFRGNKARFGGGGGAINNTQFSLSVLIDDCDFEGNEPGLFNGPGRGGAIYSRGSLTCLRSRFVGNGQITEEGTSFGGAVSGGIYRNCVFTGNKAQYGGAMADATAADCRFEDNEACAGSGGEGGATYASQLRRCNLVNNSACGIGGAVYGGSLRECRVLQNEAAYDEAFSQGYGGGIAWAEAFDTLLEDNRCQGALGGGPATRGGGAYQSTLTRCTLRGGSATWGGGAYGSELRSCLVLSNEAEIGGGTFLGSAERCTLAGNVGTTRSGAAEEGTFDTCILWHNLPADGGDNGTFAYSDVESGVPAGSGNISQDPLFVSGSPEDVRLRLASPCIDSGSPGLASDPDGSQADMGAIPFGPLPRIPTTYCDPTETFAGCRVTIIAPAAASLSAGTTIRAIGGPASSFGLFFVGTSPNYQLVPGSSPGQSNLLCVGGAINRTLAIQSTSDPLCAAEFTKFVSPTEWASTGAMAGDALYGQFWFRQPGGPTGGPSSAMSDAVYLPLTP